MYVHANAKLGLAGRFALVRAVEEGMSLKAAAAAFSGQGAGQPLRVALPGRSAAHGCLPLRALSAARARGHGRPLATTPSLDAPRDQGRLRLRARDRRRPLATRLRRAARR